MLVETHQCVSSIEISKLDSSDDEFTVPRQPSKRPMSPMKNFQAVLDDENDDDDERLARRKSRLLEPHPASANSPCASTNASRRRADAAAPRGVPQAQIGEHYGNCIRLAAENKITAKNAFNLHLIDYMSEMIKKEDFASFQIASSSLDAGAKIYAGRVDAVHQETYQVLTGLGRSGKPVASEDQDGEPRDDTVDPDGDLDSAQNKPESRKKASAHRDIIQKQLSKIRSKALASKADVDPLFQHQAAAFDEGGTVELRLNQLSSVNGSCELILDSSTRVMQFPNHRPNQSSFNITSLVEFLSPIISRPMNQLTICATLQDFRFTNWDDKQTWDPSHWDDVDTAAPDSPITIDDTKIPYPDDDLDSGGDNMDPGDFPNDSSKVIELMEECGSSAAAALASAGNGNQVEAVPVDISHPETTGTDGELFVSSLKSMLDKQYEHFGQLNDHLLGMWAGPEHWRKKAKRPKLDGLHGAADADLDADADEEANVKQVACRKSRPRKDKASKVAYGEALLASENRTRSGKLSRKEWPKNMLSTAIGNSAAANATVFKLSYRQKASRQMNMLPSEVSDSRQTLYKLLNREVTLRPNYLHDPRNTPHLNDAVSEPYNYSNVNVDFCPVLECLDKPPFSEPAVVDDDFADIDGPLDVQIHVDDDDDDDDDVAIPFECAFTQATAMNDIYGSQPDMELISQPRKVARIEIGYARTAKMINIRRLKSAMWTFLETTIPRVGPNSITAPLSPYSATSTSSAPEAASLTNSVTGDAPANQEMANPSNNGAPTGDDTHLDSSRNGAASSGPKVTGARSFTELIDSLSDRISWQMAKELSVSIALNSLLHLSNEKSLYLESIDGFSDIYISQGIPTFELDHLKSYGSNNAESDGLDKPSSKRTKTQRYRPSTLDSWLAGDDS